MNCIFVCVFGKREYYNMFKLLLESILKYGELNDDTRILVYTTSEYMNSIKKSWLYSAERIIFEINDTICDIDSACKARLDLFTFNFMKSNNGDMDKTNNSNTNTNTSTNTNNNSYNKFLYLDTDIIVKGPLEPIFETISNNVIYVLSEETRIGTYNPQQRLDYMGDLLFTRDDLKKYAGIKGFNSGIIGFNNCVEIRELFDRIRNDMIRRNHHFQDQPFFVHHAILSNLYNNILLHEYATISNSNSDINSKYVMHHFAGTPGSGSRKYPLMLEFYNSLNERTININVANTKNYIIKYLLPLVEASGEQLEGNLFTLHGTNGAFTNKFLNKIKNIGNLCMNRDLRNIMEIGFNSGFSALLILISNPLVKLTCFDIGEHKYIMSCYMKLRDTFGDRISLVIGNSMDTLPLHTGVYDLIHIDGGHSIEICKNDILCSYKLARLGTILILDDTDINHIRIIWNEFIHTLGLQPLDTHKYKTPYHDICIVTTTPTPTTTSTPTTTPILTSTPILTPNTTNIVDPR